MLTRLSLRAAAIAIAIAGLLDPAFTTAGRARARVAVIVQDGPTMELPWAAGESRRAVAERLRDRLVKNLSDYDIQPRLTSDASAVVVIGDRYQPIDAEAATVSTVTVTGEVSPNVRIVRIDAPHDVPAATAIRIGVDVEGAGVAGLSSALTVRVAGLEVGRVSHVWRSERDRWHADLDAVPVAGPPFVVRVEAQPPDGEHVRERTALDNAAETVVDLRREPLRVEVYEPRPSWATTFVRRALEADPRFEVAGLSAIAKGVSTRTADAEPLAGTRLDRFDVLIAGGLERLTSEEARALERFMRERGGAVVLVPDTSIGAGPAHELLQGLALTERLTERPEKLTVSPPLASIQASELLLVRGDLPMAERIASTTGQEPAPVIVSMPRGDGRLLLSGALDAWRFRAEDEAAFDRFWQATVAGLALAAPPPVDVSVAPPILRPGERGDVIVRVRQIQASVRASIDGKPIRLWPEAEAGAFRGSFTASDKEGRSTIVARVDAATPISASRTIIVRADSPRLMPATAAPLSLLSSSHKGIDVTPENAGAIEQFIRRTVTSPAASVTRRPMRSAWWMIPFVMCLSAEWWLRRRAGLR